MKGSLVHAIIASLEERDRKRFLASGPAIKDWEQLAQLFRFLAKQTVYSETELLAKIGQTKRVKNNQVEQLGNLLLQYIGEGAKDVIVHQILVAAPQMVEQRQERQATILIEWAISLAEETENYHAIQSLWRLADLFPDPRPQFKGMTYDHSLACAGNLVGYRQLEQQLRQIPSMPEVEEREKALAELEASQLLQSPGMALGYEARLLYWKLRAATKYLARNFADAIHPQFNLVEALGERLSEDIDVARRWIRESGSLAAIYSQTQNMDLAKATLNSISAFATSNSTLRREQIRQLYPTMISLGVDSGDETFAELACSTSLTLMTTQADLFSPWIHCQVCYFSAYFFLSTNRLAEASKILLRLRSISKGNFRPQTYAMSKFLEIVLEIESGSFEDAIRLNKNLRMARPDTVVPGISQGLQLLSHIALGLSAPKATWASVMLQPEVEKIIAELSGQTFLDYFDLFAWSRAKCSNRRMIDVLQEKALQQGNPKG